jgi:putative oxidoreductase
MSIIREVFWHFHGLEWVGIFTARSVVGLFFFLSGQAKLFQSDGRARMRQTLQEASIPLPQFTALFVSSVEFVCGGLLVLGAFTHPACVLLGGDMVVALASVRVRTVRAASVSVWLSNFLYLPEVLYLVILFWLFFSGPGWLSVDHALLFRGDLPLG